jgi:predicted nuclease with TOPRIM domain
MDISSASYSSLLSTLSGSRADLERANTRIVALETDNSRLQQAYTQVKDELTEAKKRYNEARDNYHKLSEEKMEREKQSETFLERLKTKLDEKAVELEQMQKQNRPQDADALRTSIREEIELPYKQKIRTLTDELDHCRDVCSQYKRENDRLKAENSITGENQRREVSSVRSEHDSVVGSLHDQIIALQEQREQSTAFASEDSNVRALKHRLMEQQSLIDHLKAEVTKLVAEKDQVTLQSIEFQSKMEETYAKTKVRCNANLSASVVHLSYGLSLTSKFLIPFFLCAGQDCLRRVRTPRRRTETQHLPAGL